MKAERFWQFFFLLPLIESMSFSRGRLFCRRASRFLAHSWPQNSFFTWSKNAAFVVLLHTSPNAQSESERERIWRTGHGYGDSSDFWWIQRGGVQWRNAASCPATVALLPFKCAALSIVCTTDQLNRLLTILVSLEKSHTLTVLALSRKDTHQSLSTGGVWPDSPESGLNCHRRKLDLPVVNFGVVSVWLWSSSWKQIRQLHLADQAQWRTVDGLGERFSSEVRNVLRLKENYLKRTLAAAFWTTCAWVNTLVNGVSSRSEFSLSSLSFWKFLFGIPSFR